MTGNLSALAIIFILAAVLSLLARLFRQPVILAYLGAGAVASLFGWVKFDQVAIWQVFADLGIMFLLFLIGLEINYTALRRVGAASIIVGLAQVILTFAVAMMVTTALSLPLGSAVYISLALSFSSTIVVVKILSENRNINSIVGKISVGILLVQDILAVIILLVITDLGHAQILTITTIIKVLQALGVMVLMVWLGRKLVPKIIRAVSGSIELLFLICLGWLFVMALLAEQLNFSVAIGGFIAGLSLANTAEHYQILNRTKALRDFFILIFFVLLGSTLKVSQLADVIIPIILFCLIAVLAKPLIVHWLLRGLGYHPRISILSGLSLGQISEFSFILIAIGLQLGQVTPVLASAVTMVAMITIALSAYQITWSNHLYRWLYPGERFSSKFSGSQKFIAKKYILIGAGRVGQSIAEVLPRSQICIVDFDPDIISHLRTRGYNCLFGDITDDDLFDQIDWSVTRVAISTSPNLDDVMAWLTRYHHWPKNTPRPLLVVRAESDHDVKTLYDQGADYVILPHLTSGQSFAHALQREPSLLKTLPRWRSRDLQLITNFSRTSQRS